MPGLSLAALNAQLLYSWPGQRRPAARRSHLGAARTRGTIEAGSDPGRTDSGMGGANGNRRDVGADASQLVQLLQNLIGNALKYRGTAAPRINVSALRAGPMWVFAIRDNGIGIESQYFERVFSFFQRLHTREEYPGTGIGLALCRRIVEQAGGSIWIESELGKVPPFTSRFPQPDQFQ